MRWLSEHHPALLPRYRRLYRHSAYAPKDYQAEITGQVRELARRYGVGATTPAAGRSVGASLGMGPVRGQRPRGAGGRGAAAAGATREAIRPAPMQLSLL